MKPERTIPAFANATYLWLAPKHPSEIAKKHFISNLAEIKA